MMLSSTYSLIKKNNVSLSVAHNNKNYLIGAANYQVAHIIKSNLENNNSKLYLYRPNVHDITKDVHFGLSAMNMNHIKVNKITIGTNVELSIYKDHTLYPRSTIDGYHSYDNKYDSNSESDTDKENLFSIEKIHAQDFLMYPIEKNIGILIPYEYVRENSEVITFMSNIVDPSDDPELFKKTLRM